ncbi:hypothetical protein Goshw_011538 [Gossypium schwendimanii]|uniref:Uncharacterized protein n=1 Tax=Gossypium schwendimanii TaxID=34291 RepID=A0A7J9L2P5_GOSSC|nr:hypothetical protein [Gossypium schwendimanii]
MNNKACSSALFLLICFLLIVSECFTVESDPMTCKPSGKIGWFNKTKRCRKFVKTYGNGRSVKARIVDEYDSVMGYDAEHMVTNHHEITTS